VRIETFVPNVETCQRLKDVGLKQDSLYSWVFHPPDWVLDGAASAEFDQCSAFTVGELGLMLMETEIRHYPHQVSLMSALGSLTISEAEFRAKMILFMIDCGFMTDDWKVLWIGGYESKVQI
jgi:hypothetical protein|tara:strand:+ start:294 stop:659 length:366 start_codon:yes stop_codon:yes gene_type:complete